MGGRQYAARQLGQLLRDSVQLLSLQLRAAGAAGDFVGSPYFTFIPWDYDNCLGIDYFGTRWQYADILDWPASTGRYWRGHATSRIPLVQNLLRNHEYRQYYLDYLEHLLETEFNPRAITALIEAGSGDGLWGRVRRGAYLEAGTAHGWPFTGRQFTNDEVYRSGCRQYELRRGRRMVDGIVHYVRMRRDSARHQLKQLRATMPRATDGDAFPATMETLPLQAELIAGLSRRHEAARGYRAGHRRSRMTADIRPCPPVARPPAALPSGDYRDSGAARDHVVMAEGVPWIA